MGHDDDRELEEALAAALEPGPPRLPPPDRVAALRAQVEARARNAGHINGGAANVVALDRTSARPRRRDVLVGGIAASIGVALGVGGVVVTGGDDDSDGPPTEPISFAAAATGVTTEASLIAHTWGTELLLDVAGLPAEQDYQVLYSPPSGDAVLAGSFRSVADTLMKCRFNASLLRDDLTAVVITEPGGGEVLRADLT